MTGGLHPDNKASHYRHAGRIQGKPLVKISGLAHQLLRRLASGHALQPAQWQTLTCLEEADRPRAIALGYPADSLQSLLEARAALLWQVYPAFEAWCDRRLGHPETYLAPLWLVWLPLAQWLIQARQGLDRPLVQGILGGQGTGKTTLGEILTLILHQSGRSTLSWSLDDLYKTYRDRLQLQAQEPQLIWRGPPGTHDVELGLQVLDQLRAPKADRPVWVPRFDKSLHGGQGDRIAPEPVTHVDIILFEGWFVGVRPVDPQVFDNPPEPIVTARDRAFALAINERLQTYLPLWERLDHLWILYLPDYRLSKHWRKQAEREMKASGKPGMTDEQVDHFVDYFWRSLHPALFIPPLLPHADLILEINADHAPGRLYSGTTVSDPTSGDPASGDPTSGDPTSGDPTSGKQR